jgi:TPR repeat protein
MLAQMYQHGYGVKQDVQEAIMWYRKAQSQGHAQATLALAQIYEHGAEGVPADAVLAASLYKEAAGYQAR